MAMRALFTLLLCLFTAMASAQSHEENTIRRLYTLMQEDTLSTLPPYVLPQLQELDTARVATLSDSLRYAYHYTYATALNNTPSLDTVATLHHTQAAVALLEQRLGVHSAGYLDLYGISAGIQYTRGDINGAMQCLQHGIVTVASLFDDETTTDLRQRKAAVYSQLAFLYEDMAHSERTPAYCELAAQCQRKVFDAISADTTQHDTARIQPLIELARMQYVTMGDAQSSMGTYNEIVRYLDRQGDPHGWAQAVPLNELAFVQMALGQYGAAQQSAERAVAIVKAAQDVPTDLYASVYTTYCELLVGRGDDVSSLLEDIREHTTGIYTYFYYLAAAQYEMLPMPEARDKVLARVEAFPKRDQVDGLYGLAFDATSAARRIPVAPVAHFMADRRKLATRVYGAESREALNYDRTLATCLLQSGDSVAARGVLADIIARQERHGVSDTVAYLPSLNDETMFCRLTHDYERGVETATRVITLAEAIGARGDEWRANALYEKGLALHALGRPSEAMLCFVDAQVLVEQMGRQYYAGALNAQRELARCFISLGRKQDALERLRVLREREIEEQGQEDPQTRALLDELQ